MALHVTTATNATEVKNKKSNKIELSGMGVEDRLSYEFIYGHLPV